MCVWFALVLVLVWVFLAQLRSTTRGLVRTGKRKTPPPLLLLLLLLLSVGQGRTGQDRTGQGGHLV
jgi:hypothetical protein